MFLPNGTERPTGFQSWIGKMVKTATGNTGAGTASLKKKTKTWESPAREKKKASHMGEEEEVRSEEEEEHNAEGGEFRLE
jgi:hypothetical protein